MKRIPLIYHTDMIPESHGPASIVAAYIAAILHDPTAVEIDRETSGADFAVKCSLPEYVGMRFERELMQWGFHVFADYGPGRDNRGERRLIHLRIAGPETDEQRQHMAQAFDRLVHAQHGHHRDEFWRNLRFSGRQYINPITGDWLDANMAARTMAAETRWAEQVLRENRTIARGSRERGSLLGRVRELRRPQQNDFGKF